MTVYKPLRPSGDGGVDPASTASTVSFTSDPTVTDDIDAGYEVGDRWVNTASDTIFSCADNAAGAAVWVDVTGSGITDHTGLTNIGTTTHPQIDTHVADATIHFTEGSIQHSNIQGGGGSWSHAGIDAHIDQYIIADVGDRPHGIPLHKYDATVVPTPQDDSANTAGRGTYAIGSIWLNTTTDQVYQCADATPNAAVWRLMVDSNSPQGITGKTISDSTIRLKSAAFAVPSSEGEIVWDSANFRLAIGDGSSEQLFLPAGTDPDYATAAHEADATVHFTQGSISITESQISDLGTYVPASEKAAANGVATLDAGSKVPVSQLPALSLTTTNTVADETAQLALTAEEGDLAIRTDENKTYVHNGGVAGTMADWSELLTPTDQVSSVDGRTGAVTLSDLYAPAAEGVTGGDSHDHSGGDGAAIPDGGLASGATVVSAGAGDSGKLVKLDADGHVDASTINDADIDHANIGNVGTNSHAAIDTHIATINGFVDQDVKSGAAPTLDGTNITNVSADGISGVAIGTVSAEPTAPGTENLAIGSGAATNAGGLYGIAIGKNATLLGAGASQIAIGENAVIGTSGGDMAIGEDALTNGSNAICIGGRGQTNATATGSYALAYGNGARATGLTSTAIGANAQATNSYAVALGGAQSTADRVIASGQYSLAVGFRSNATTSYAVALGAFSNATQQLTVALGANAQATGEDSFAVGYQSDASGLDSVSIGRDTEASGSRSVAIVGANDDAANAALANATDALAIGSNTAATADGAIAFGAQSESSAAGAVALGKTAKATRANEVSFATGSANLKNGHVSLTADTADATPTEVSSPSSGFLTVPTDTSIMFAAHIVARRTDADGESAAYILRGCLHNNAGTTALVGGITKEVLGESVAAWDVAASADDTNDRLAINVTGEAAKSIRWLARVEYTEVTG
jgi:hypothetical protein